MTVHQSGSAQTPVSLTACRTITASGSYVVASNIFSSTPADGACFVIKANNVTLDGNGKRLTITNGYAVDIQDIGETARNWHDITVKDLQSNKGVRTFGNGIARVTLDGLTVAGIDVIGSDDVTVSNNTVGDDGIQINNGDRTGWKPLRPTVSRNTITGSAVNSAALFEIVGGKDHPCPRIDATVDHNVITSNRDTPEGEPGAAVRVRCATHTTFTNNTVRSTGTARGLYLRDESDDGTYRNNVFWSHSLPALHIGSGNVDKTFPSRNVFETNTFQSDASHAAYLLGLGSGNRFTDVVFWSMGEDFLGWYGGNGGNTFDHVTFYAAGSSTRSLMLGRDANNPAPPADAFTNNIFSYQSTVPIFNYDGWTKSQWSGDHNVYHNRSGSVSFGSLGSSLAAWRATPPASDARSMEADPLLNDAASGDFTLKTGSPARSAGSNDTDIGSQTFATGAPWCSEQWTCGNWSSCYAGQQTRTCIDQHACGTTVLRPAQSQTCIMTDTSAPAAIGDLIAR